MKTPIVLKNGNRTEKHFVMPPPLGPMIFYVYVHRRKDTGEVFYVGKGCDERAWEVETRSRAWMKVACEHGRTVEVIAKGMAEGFAYMLEKELIANYRRNGAELVNVADGGNGGRRVATGKVTTAFKPWDIINGVEYYNWTVLWGPRAGNQIESVEGMMKKYGGSKKEWMDVVNRKSDVARERWGIQKYGRKR